MEDYQRVIPRDLFNEAKLLKCMGRLCLLIHDKLVPVEMEVGYDSNYPFKVALLPEGSLIIRNVHIYIKETRYLFTTQYNSKSAYPLFVHFRDVEYRVFNEQGEFDEEFHEFLKLISK